MHVGRRRHDRLGAADDDAVRPALGDMHIAVAVGLQAGPFGTIALGVRHGDTDGQILVLDSVQVVHETRVMVRAESGLDLLGSLEDPVGRVVREIPHGAAGLPAKQSHRLELVQQIGGVFVDVQHPVDGLAGGRLARRHQQPMLGIEGEVVADAGRRDAGSQQGLVGHAFDALAVHEHPRLVAAEAFPIVGGGHQHRRFLGFVIVIILLRAAGPGVLFPHRMTTSAQTR